jgi:hypothetical protein
MRAEFTGVPPQGKDGAVLSGRLAWRLGSVTTPGVT